MQSCAKYGNIVSWFFETIFHILCGALAQLGAHHTGSVGVRGSNPLCSTILNENPEFLAISGFFHTATEVHLHDFVFFCALLADSAIILLAFSYNFCYTGNVFRI